MGFYSAFIVADRVTVRSRAAGFDADAGVQWESAGEGDFTVANIEKAQRGTDIILHLRDEEKEFLDEWRLKSIIGKYSDHISIPVEMWQEGEPEREQEGETIPATEGQWNAVNKATALWTRSKSDISDEEYQEFYKHVAHDFEDPLAWVHNKVEGKQEYTSLLYIPGRAPFDLWNRERQQGLKLYVQRVFIMDDAEQFMPQYLRFVKGLLDSNDLPLNVSREILQDNKVTQSLRSALTKRVLTMLDRMASNDAEKYQKFWGEFGNVLKEGPAEDQGNKEKIAKLLRFASTHNDSSAETVSLEEYLSRAIEGQEKIYYIVADSYQAAKNSPHLELLRKKGIEVLLMSERIDEWLMSHLTEFDGKQFVSVTQGDLQLPESDEEKAEAEKQAQEHEALLSRFQTSLGDKVKEVKVSQRLTDSPSCIVTSEQDMSSQMVKMMKAMGQEVPEVKPVFELNLEHPLVAKLEQEQDEERFGKWAELLLSQAMLAERGSLEDPSQFVAQMNSLWLELSK